MSDLYYERHGNAAKTLVLLHSGGMSGEEWRPQIARFSKRYRVLVPDLPGHGRSPLEDEHLTIAKTARAVLAMLDREGIEATYLCGSSLGAAVAMWLLLNHPQRVEKAVFYRVSYRKNGATFAQTAAMADPEYWRRFGLEKWLSGLHLPQGGPDAWKQVIARVSGALDPAVSDHAHTPADFAAITAPVLLVVGDRDPVAPLDEILLLYRKIPDCGLWILPFASHITATNTWRAEAFAEEVVRFLGRSGKTA